MQTFLIGPGSFIAIGVGAALGAWARWGLALWLNAGSARLPWGTLAANLAGGYLIGLLLALIAANPQWPEWVRLALVTGFLGALTTFSTFSAEVVNLLQTGRPLAAMAYVGVSLAGSFAATAAGLYTVHALRSAL